MTKDTLNQITPKQKLFCEYFISKEYRYNATKSYAEAYGLDLDNKSNYNTAKSNGHRLLTNAYIQEEISWLLNKNGLFKINADIHLLSLIKQRDNLSVQLRAIKLFYKIHGLLRQHTQRSSKNETKPMSLSELYDKSQEMQKAEENSEKLKLEPQNVVVGESE